jgi:hypothetical protein
MVMGRVGQFWAAAGAVAARRAVSAMIVLVGDTSPFQAVFTANALANYILARPPGGRKAQAES